MKRLISVEQTHSSARWLPPLTMVCFVFAHNHIPTDLRMHMGYTYFEMAVDFSLAAMLNSAGKVKHIVFFALIHLLLVRAYRSTPSRWSPLRRTLVSLAALSLLIEFHQAFIAGRDACLQDVIPNIIGVLLALVVGKIRSGTRAER